jgi:twinkle protein
MGQMSAAAMRYLNDRGLDIEVAASKGLFSERAGDGGEILVFPFVRDGAVINHKRRVLPKEKMWQDKGAPKAAWNEDALRDDSLLSQPLIITEGEFDALAAIQCGFLRTISVPDGAPPPGNRSAEEAARSPKYAWLQAVSAFTTKERAPEIIIAADGDENGGALLHDLSHQLGRPRCKRLVYPLAKDPEKRGRPRLKDLNEVLEDYGHRGVVETIGKAEWLKVPGLYTMSELPEPPVVQVWELGEDFRLLSENMRLRPGDLSVVTGIPNYGKSTFANAIWCDLVQRYGLRVVWASFEQQPKPDHRRNLRNWYWRSSMILSEAQLREADQWIEDHHLFIRPPEDVDATLELILELASTAVVQRGANALVIDPWNEIEHIRDRHISLTEYVSSSLRELRRFARAFNIHIMILAHPTKAVQGEGGNYRRPRMYDISDSSAWYNKADLGIIVHRPNEDETQVVVEKSRYHEILGAPGEVFMHFSRDAKRYVEIGRASLFTEADEGFGKSKTKRKA